MPVWRDIKPVGGVSSTKIPRDTSIFVTTPEDGSYGETRCAGSGEAVANAFQSMLARYVKDVSVGGVCLDTDQAIEAAKKKKCGYVVIARITHWEDRATEWSGRRDKLEIMVKIVRIEDGTIIRNVTISGISRWLTLGGTHPQDLLKEPIDDFAEELF